MKPKRILVPLFFSLSLFSFSHRGSSIPDQPHTVSFDEQGLKVDGRYVPLVSGEFHYWRHNSLYWKKILQTMKDAGLEIVSTYVPWNFHEVELGSYDFAGETNPARNLSGFLDLCREMDLKVIIRPGPYIGAEWKDGGVPADVTNIDHLDPRFIERSRQWIAAVCTVLAPRQYTRGGPILLYQIENEIFFPWWTRPSEPYGKDQQTYTYDVKFVMSKYRAWLKGKYGSIEHFNESFGLTYSSFDDAQPPNFRKDPLALSLKSWEFVSDAILEYFRALTAEFVRGGMDVPSYANIGQFIVFYDYQGLETIVNSVGLDLYMFNMLPRDEAVVVNWYNRLFAARQKFPWSPEFQCGIWRSWSEQSGFITGKHQEYLTLLSLACGLRGFNYYMFVNRDRWSYGAVDELGEPEGDRKYDRMKGTIEVAKRLTSDTHLAKVGLLWHLAHNQKHLIYTYKDWQDAGNYFLDRQGPKETPSWWNTFRELTHLDLDFDLVVLPSADLSNYEAVIYAGPDFLDEGSLRKLEAYVKQGGRFIVTGEFPTKNIEQESPAAVQALSKTLHTSKNTIIVQSEELGRLLAELKVPRFISTEGNGVVSTIYQADARRYTFVVANTTDSVRKVTYELGPGLLERTVEYSRKNLLSGEFLSGKGADLVLGSETIEAKQVLVYTISPSP